MNKQGIKVAHFGGNIFTHVAVPKQFSMNLDKGCYWDSIPVISELEHESSSYSSINPHLQKSL